MSRLYFSLIVGAVVAVYVVIAFWKTPRSEGGKLARILCLVNATSWILILPLDVRGHPPPIVIAGALLWLLNLPLLIAALAASWVAFKDGQENKPYLLTSVLYLVANAVTLWIVPAVALVSYR